MTNQPSDPKNKPQNDFWDLGDDDLDPGEAMDSSPSKEQSSPQSVIQATPKLQIAAPEDDLGNLEEDFPTKAAPSPKSVSAAPTKPQFEPRRVRVKEGKKEVKPTTAIEKMFIGLLLAGLMGVAIWGVQTYLESAPNGELAEYTEDFPIQGETVNIQNVETWWREPVRDGDDPDIGVVIEARLIPCASIKISDSSSANLQVSFRNGENKLIGDTINLPVNNGKFEKNDSNEISVHSTSGFTNPTEINPYVNQDIEPWTLVIVEDGKAGEPLVKARIEANRKEK